MSRNDVVVVARHRGKFYVLGPLNADEQWNVDYVRTLLSTSKFTRERGKALVIAHDMQGKLGTEYGVRELRVPEVPGNASRDTSLDF